MTDTRQTGTARHEASQIVHRTLGEVEGYMLRADTPGALLDAIPTDLLQRLHDERLMTTCRVCAGTGTIRRIRARKLHTDTCPKCNGSGRRAR